MLNFLLLIRQIENLSMYISIEGHPFTLLLENALPVIKKIKARLP